MRDWLRNLSETRRGWLVSLTLVVIVFGYLLLIELLV
jgi:hypothetical protein